MRKFFEEHYFKIAYFIVTSLLTILSNRFLQEEGLRWKEEMLSDTLIQFTTIKFGNNPVEEVTFTFLVRDTANLSIDTKEYPIIQPVRSDPQFYQHVSTVGDLGNIQEREQWISQIANLQPGEYVWNIRLVSRDRARLAPNSYFFGIRNADLNIKPWRFYDVIYQYPMGSSLAILVLVVLIGILGFKVEKKGSATEKIIISPSQYKKAHDNDQ